MKTAVRKHLKDFFAILAIAVVAIAVGTFVLSHQRFYLPHWVPIVGSDFVDYNAEFQTAQAVTPGQGQTVIIAGVPVGEIGKVTLRNGRAQVQMKLRRKYTPIFKDSTALLRPKTGLQDMTIELDPGSRAAGEIKAGGTLPISRTQPNVNPDEFFAGFDTDTRNYLALLVGGLGEGLKGNSQQLSATLKRFDPTARYLDRIGRALGKRSANIKRSIHNFRLLAQALGQRDTQLSQFVDSSNAVFRSFAAQDANLRATLGLLPGALQRTNAALDKSQTLSQQLGPTLGALRPTARGLEPALKSFQTFAKETQPAIENQLRPFVKQAQPPVAELRPAARNLAAALPDLDTSLGVVNTLFNELAYNPTSGPNKGKGYLYWLGWLNHIGASIFGSQDANGPIRRGIVFGNCTTLTVFERVGTVNPLLGTLAALLNAPKAAEACGGPTTTRSVKAGAGSTTPSPAGAAAAPAAAAPAPAASGAAGGAGAVGTAAAAGR